MLIICFFRSQYNNLLISSSSFSFYDFLIFVIVNNEYSNVNNGKKDVNGQTSTSVGTCSFSTSTTCSSINSELFASAICVLRTPNEKGKYKRYRYIHIYDKAGKKEQNIKN